MADPADGSRDREETDAPASDPTRAIDVASSQDAAQLRPGDPGNAGYPVSETEYWRETHVHEPYYESGRSFEDYSTAYELGWVTFNVYGGEFEIAKRVLANDWMVRKGISTLSWEQAEPAVRAGWQRAENAKSYTSDGSASGEQVLSTLHHLLQDARQSELGFREACEHTETPDLIAAFERLAQSCALAAADWQDQIQSRGGTTEEGASGSGAAHRIWMQIRGLFGGAGDRLMLRECERGLQALLQGCELALRQNLPPELHARVQRQFEDVQRNQEHIRRLRGPSAADTESSSELAA